MLDHQQIIKRICEEHGLTELEVLSKRRQHRLMACRVEIAQALRALPGEPSYSQIGEWMGGRDHTSILYYLGGKERKASRLKSNPSADISSAVSETIVDGITLAELIDYERRSV